MSEFYLYLRSTASGIDELVGMQHPDMAAAQREALRLARELWGEMLFRGFDPKSFLFEITDKAGEVLMTVPFTDLF
jgi:hypothetical protein